MPDEARSFLDNLVHEVEDEIDDKAKTKEHSTKRGGSKTVNSDASPDDENPKVVDIVASYEPSDSAPLQSGRKRNKEKRHVAKVHAKARVQKSIRFLPHLIVELDEYLRKGDPEGSETIQTVMNQALRMWLKANVKK